MDIELEDKEAERKERELSPFNIVEPCEPQGNVVDRRILHELTGRRISEADFLDDSSVLSDNDNSDDDDNDGEMHTQFSIDAGGP